MLLSIASLDITDILVKLLQVFLTREIANRRAARTLGHIKMEAFGLNSLVALRCGIKIGKLYWRNIVFALMARNNQEIVNL